MVVGEDMPLFIDDETRSGPLLLPLASIGILERVIGAKKSLEKRMVEKLFVLGVHVDCAGHGDMDNRRPDVFDHPGKSLG